MKQKFKRQFPVFGFVLMLTLVFSSYTSIGAQAQERISGTVTGSDGFPIPGVNVLQKGTNNGAVTDFDGEYNITLRAGSKVLVFSYIGYKTKEVDVSGKTSVNVVIEEDVEGLDEVVVVGYGTQKKESVVAAITQIKGEDLQELTSGITNVAEALQGNLPGVTTIQGSGVPGRNDVQIFVRGLATFNGTGGPLILVDGVPRDLDNIDFNDIENLSVLKDASATAVFGVQGANGVILITTKRGKKGKAQLSLQANTTLKTVSRLPEKLDAYSAILEANSSILRELPHEEASWLAFRPIEIADNYRNPANEEERLLFPNVDWEDVLLKDMAQDYRVNLSVRGGGDKSRYFGSLAYQKVSDIFDGASFDNGKGYESEFSYDRFNFRSNIDFDITNTTEFSVNLGGFYAIQQTPGSLNLVTNSIYELAANAYTPVFPDGAFGRDLQDVFANTNPLVTLTNTGYTTTRTFQINTDFILKQKLDFITKGLSFQGRFSLDNSSQSRQRLLDPGADGQENVTYRVYDRFLNEIIESPDGVNDFGFVPFPWRLEAEAIQNGTIVRNLLYDFSFNYSNTFAEKHTVTGLLLARRQERGRGNGFLTLREDWASRITYDYDKRYFLDISGAYNGSEKYGPDFRFDLFPAIGAGWTVSNEAFMENVDWVNKLKIRGSYGLIGDDQAGRRFEYLPTFSIGGGAFINPDQSNIAEDRYVFYREENVGNPNLQWETAIKYNFGAEIGLFNNAISAEFDFYGENRSDILIQSDDRAVPEWFGARPPAFNRGKVEVRGFELVLSANHTFGNGLNIFGNVNYTQAKDLVIDREDPEFRPFWQKAAGYPIGQPRSAIPGNILASLDDLYSSTPRVNGQSFIRTGYYNLHDYDGDGVYNANFDNIPFGFPTRPQRTWAATVGAKYKGWKLSVQFYGAQNSNRDYLSRTFTNQTDTFFAHELGYWTKDNPTGTRTQPTFSFDQGASDPRRNFWSGSLTRLRAIALNYTVPKKTCEKLGVKGLSIFANGNNLFLWTDLPDDREFNSSLTADSRFRGDYPNLARFNFGFNLDF
ncbi:SusC/RagA family TonB-linked outer membrane protein [Hyunsoonleella pacifica]|nr:SusC/RagA family TonB-linked outer membrane protein [Hyunsoonleella pacifica]